jgi:hypothetical protein
MGRPMKARMRRGSLPAILMFFAFGCAGTAALGDELIVTRAGDFGAEAEFINRFIEKEKEPGWLPESYSRERSVTIGRYDLNEDGSPELIIVVDNSMFCGSIGCHPDIFEKRGGLWRDIGGVSAHGILVMRERVCGYRSLKGTEGIYRWNGYTYDFAYCFPNQVECRHIAVEYDEPEKLDPDNGLIAPEDCPKPGRG